MKHLLILTVGICLLLVSVPAMADQASDEAAIRAATEKFQDAMNKHDIEAVSALFDENFQSWTGDRKSRADAVKFAKMRFERQKAHQRKLSKEVGIDFITPDIAIHKYYEEWTGWIGADGKTQPPTKTFTGCLYVRKNGNWLRRTAFWRMETE